MLLTLARLNLRVFNNEAALKYLDLILKVKAGEITPQLFLWYVEVLYRLNRYPEIHQFCISYKYRVKGDAAAEEMAKSTIDLWISSNEA